MPPAVSFSTAGGVFRGVSMSNSDFMVKLLDVVFFLFDKSENIILLVMFSVLLFCFSFQIIRKLGRF